MAKSDLTRTGARRLGDEYQDLIAAETLISWLERPDHYQWVRVEADEAGYLDDVVALSSDGTLEVSQVKFSTHADSENDPWSWEVLLETPLGKSGKPTTSLLQKWSFSLDRLLQAGQPHDASVVSNRKPAPDVAEALSAEGFVDFDRIRSSETKEAISQQLGGDDVARAFFSKLRFSLKRPSIRDLEDALRRRFYRLGGTDKGWLNLKETLGSWVHYRYEPPPDGTIHLGDVRRAALWYSLQALPQKFEIPPDYVLPSEQFHEALLERLRALRSGCLVLTAPPGYGKSTYSSWLYQQLGEKGIPAIRHHYFLSLKDRSSWARLDHERAAESLMADLLLEHSEALGALASENPHPDKGDLTKWLEACGIYYAARNEALIVIVDGLDHVWREKQQSIEELNRLLGLILPAPEGVVVFLATQPVDDAQLPRSLLRAAPKKDWIRLPLLDQVAVARWLRQHEKELAPVGEVDLPEHTFIDLVSAFYQKSKGHPLYLRYALKALQEQGMAVTERNVQRLPGCPHEDISAYYAELWQALPEEGRVILHLLAACSFPWPRRSIVDCLDPQGLNLSHTNSALRQVEHLLVHDDLGLRPFHSSLLVFVRGTPEHADCAIVQRRRTLEWLRKRAPDYWKWAYEWRLSYELGDEAPIMAGPDRGWIIDAIAKRRPSQDIDDVLSSSITTALRRGNLSRAVELGLLREYALYYNTEEFGSPIIQMLLYPQLGVEEDPHLRPRLRSDRSAAMDGELVLLAESEAARGNTEEVELCFEELNSRLRASRLHGARRVSTTWSAQVEPVLKVAALADYPNAKHIINWAIRNREVGYTPEMLSIFGIQMRASGNTTGMRTILKLIEQGTEPQQSENNHEGSSANTLTTHEKSGILRSATLLALEQGISLDELILNEHNSADPFVCIYAAVRRDAAYTIGSIDFPDAELLSLKPVEHYERSGNITDFFYQAFFCLLANHLWSNSARNTEWLRAIDKYTWSHRFLGKLNQVAADLASMLLSASPPPFSWFYCQLLDFAKPDWEHDHDESELKYSSAATRAAVRIGLDVFCLAKAMSNGIAISQADLETAFASGYCYVETWLECYIANRRARLNKEAVLWLLEEREQQLSASIEQFTTRAEQYAILASVAALHGLEDEARHLISQAASNLVAHGNHKDMLYNDVLEAIEACHDAYSAEAENWSDCTRSWLLQLAPAIAEITEYTDGDETGHLPRYLAPLLAKIAPDLLSAYYQWLSTKDEYYNALHAFHVILETSDLSDPINQAIATTAVDDRSLTILAERAMRGDVGAEAVLLRLLSLLGENALNRKSSDESEASGSKYDREEKPIAVGDYPPEQFERYLDMLKREYLIYSEQQIASWIEYWSQAGRKEQVFRGLEGAVNRDLNIGNYDVVFDLALGLYGKGQAYKWLVKAHSEESGWERYFTDEARAVRRWHIVKEHYPTRWYDFLRDTLLQGTRYRTLTMGHSAFVRIVEYCIFMEQADLVRQLMVQMVSSSLELVSPLALPVPTWSVVESKS